MESLHWKDWKPSGTTVCSDIVYVAMNIAIHSTTLSTPCVLSKLSFSDSVGTASVKSYHHVIVFLLMLNLCSLSSPYTGFRDFRSLTEGSLKVLCLGGHVDCLDSVHSRVVACLLSVLIKGLLMYASKV